MIADYVLKSREVAPRKRQRPNKVQITPLQRAAAGDQYSGLVQYVVVSPCPLRMNYYDKFGRFFFDIHNNHNTERMLDTVRSYFTEDNTMLIRHVGTEPNPLGMTKERCVAGYADYLVHFQRFVHRLPDAHYIAQSSRTCRHSDSLTVNLYKASLAGTLVLTIAVPKEMSDAMEGVQTMSMQEIEDINAAVTALTLTPISSDSSAISTVSVDGKPLACASEAEETMAMLDLLGPAVHALDSSGAERMLCSNHPSIYAESVVSGIAPEARPDPSLAAQVIFKTVQVPVEVTVLIKAYFLHDEANRINHTELYYYDHRNASASANNSPNL